MKVLPVCFLAFVFLAASVMAAPVRVVVTGEGASAAALAGTIRNHHAATELAQDFPGPGKLPARAN